MGHSKMWKVVAKETTINTKISPLHIAAAEGTPKEIEGFLLLDVPIDNRDKRGTTPLLLCAARGTLENIKVLVEAGANLRAVDKNGESALHHAVTNCRTSEIIPYLLQRGILSNSVDKKGNMPLHTCAEAGNLNNLKVLLDFDSDLSRKNGLGQTALHRAALNKDTAGVLAYLLNKGMSMDARDDSVYAAIHRCAAGGTKINMQVLLRKGCDIEMKTKEGFTPLYCAHWNENAQEMIEYLLSQGAALDSRDKFGNSPLHHYAAQGTLEIVKFLVEKGANIRAKNSHGGTVLQYAVENENNGVVEFFVDQGIPLEDKRRDNGATALLCCAGQGTLGNLRVLVQRGANVHARTKTEQTAIHNATMNDNAVPIIEFLLKQRLSIDARDNFGRTPLHYAAKIFHGFKSLRPVAAKRDKIETLEYLLRRGASIDVKNNNGRTPLLTCALDGSLQKMKLLVEKGGDIGDRSESGLSSLHLAAANTKTTHIMKYLLDQGVPIEVKDKSGVTPLLFCAANGNLRGVKFLCEQGADLKSLDNYKRTALHHAATNVKGGPIIEYLLAKGIPLDVRDDQGFSPFLIAKGCGIAENERILLEKNIERALNSAGRL